MGHRMCVILAGMLFEDSQYDFLDLRCIWNRGQCDFRRFLAVDVVKDGSGDKPSFLPPLVLQDLGNPCLLGVTQIKLHSKAAKMLFISHVYHLPEWHTR